MKTRKVLWIDDDLPKMQIYSEALRSAGFDVTEAQDPHVALDLCKSSEFDLLMVDLRMDEMDGVDFIEEALSFQSRAAILVVSSYLYYVDYRTRLDALDVPYGKLEKPFPNVEDNEFKLVVLDKLTTLCEVGRTHIETEERSKTDGVDPFEINYRDFMALPIDERNKLHDKALTLAKKTVNEYLQNGNDWILLCGSATIPRLCVKNRRERPSEPEVLEFAEKLKKAPYPFSRGTAPEECWTGCPRNEDVTGYPTVSLRFPKGDVTVHFDTGAPITFFSYEEIVHLGGMQPSRLPLLAIRYPGGPGMTYRCVTFNAECEFICQQDGQTQHINLSGEAVWNWDQSCFVKACGKERETGCECRVVFGRSIPKHRLALVGRGLLIDNAFKLVLDGETRQTRLPKEGE